MEDIGKSALIAIVGLMTSAAMVAGGMLLTPTDVSERRVAVAVPPQPQSRPQQPLSGHEHGPEQPALAVRVPAAPVGPSLTVPSTGARLAPIFAPRLGEAGLPSLEGSARPPLPARRTFASGPETPAVSVRVPKAPEHPTPTVPAEAAERRVAAASPPRLDEARLPSLEGSARPPRPQPARRSFAHGPEQPALSMRLPAAPEYPWTQVPAATIDARRAAPPRLVEAGPPSLEGSTRPPWPRPARRAFARGPEQPALTMQLPSTPERPSLSVSNSAVEADRTLPPTRVDAAPLPALDNAAPTPNAKPDHRQTRLADEPARADAPAAPAAVRVAGLPAAAERSNAVANPPAFGLAPAPTRSDGALPPWRRYAALTPVDNGNPMIAVIIDDVGLNRQRMARTIAMPGPLTLAILPYAEDIPAWAAKARAAGHELLAHIPMEPTDADEDPGPNALLVELEPAELARRIEWNLARFEGYVGVNNHMGSRFTANRAVMAPLLKRIADRGLLFVDSLTSNASVAGEIARAYGMPTTARDIFLDNDIDAANIGMQIDKLERCAIRKGHCIAIGHPHPETLGALERWLPGLAGRGFQLVPISAIVARRMTG